MRIIPKKTKISIELFKGIGLADILIGLLFIYFAVLALTSTIVGKYYIAASIIVVGIMLLLRVEDEPYYLFFLSVLRHLVSRKSYSREANGANNIENFNAFKKIEDGFIVYDEYYGAAIEIPPVEFRFFSAYRRRASIDDCLGNVLRSLNGDYAANLVKIERRVPYDDYIAGEKEKIKDLRRCYECALITEEEFQAKCEIVFDRVAELERMNERDYTVTAFYYLVLFDSDKNRLRLQLNSAINVLRRGEMQPRLLDSKGLALFLKYSNALDFDEKELDSLKENEYASWAMPESVQIKAKEQVVDDITSYTMVISNYPLLVGDAWLASVMSIPATKVVVKLQPMDKQKTIRNIDRSISELRGRYRNTGVDSALIEINDHIRSLSELLSLLKSDNEVLLNTDVYVTCYDVPATKKAGREEAAARSHRANISNMRSVVRRSYREAELRLSDLQFNQQKGYLGSQISAYDPFAKTMGRGIPGSTAAAIYPWVFARVQDPRGIKLGREDGIPVFVDLFRRDSERVNSNVVIVGKTGSGKSYAAKSILVNLAADNSKIFVLDPENEYTELAENLHGKFINVGNAQQGRMNPFQIITALDDDDTEGGVTGSYASHMQFLEEFFRQILPDCEKEALEYLNTLADRVYMHKGITAETNLSLLTPEDYPTFSDLYDEILKEFQTTSNDYLRTMLRTLMNYVSKFSTGGRNANIWNGPSTITTEENFTVFNFQSLLSGGNKTVTNAQMLLVMKYIDNEIIKNREYNARYGTKRKIVVVIDEAHVFIDEKYPIALDFMFQLAKRIRKYNGMQIVITQNIKDFVGSEEISRKSSAIINACQYSFIFPLAPNDMGDLCKLYEKAGGINENEQEKIVTAPRGNAFVILGATSRSSFQVEVPNDVVQVFEEHNVGTRYFNGEDGHAAWEDFLGDSREKHLLNRKVRALPAATSLEEERPSRVSFTEVSAEEYELEQRQLREAERLRAEQERPVTLLQSPEKPESPAPAEELPVRPAPAEEQIVRQIVIERDSGRSNGEMAQMVSELHRMVDSMATLGEIIRMQTAAKTVAAPAPAEPAPAPIVEPRAEPDIEPGIERSAEEPAPDDENELFLDFSEEDESEPEQEQASEENGFILGNIFDIYSELYKDEEPEEPEEPEETLKEKLEKLANMEEAVSDINEEEDEEEFNSKPLFELFEESEKVNILDFLEKSIEEINNVSVLDDMNEQKEYVRRLTLDELGQVIKSRKQN